MKKLLLILTILLFTVPAFGVTLAWDANTDTAIGYIVYYQETGSDIIYHETVTPPGIETVQFTIDDSKFNPGMENSFWLTAYNNSAESGSSNIVKWTAPDAPVFVPTDDPAPVIINILNNPETLTINIGGQ